MHCFATTKTEWSSVTPSGTMLLESARLLTGFTLLTGNHYLLTLTFFIQMFVIWRGCFVAVCVSLRVQESPQTSVMQEIS